MKRSLLLFFILFIPPLLHAEEKEKEMRTVTKVIDGMTLELDGKDTVRLIGVLTPSPDSSNEAVRRWAPKTKEFTQKLVEGRQVWLEGEKTDDKGNKWAFVNFTMKLKEIQPLIDKSFMPFWGTAGNFMLNRMLIELGYASVRSPFSFKYRSQFTQLEKRAKNKGYGMWQDFQY